MQKIINFMQLNKDIKKNLETFIYHKGFTQHLIEITNEDLNNALNLITDKNIILSYDIEFYHNLIDYKDKNYKYFHLNNINNLTYILTVRELGGLMFIKNNNWFFIGYFLNVFKPVINSDDMIPILSTFSSCTDKTINKMKEIEECILFNKKKYYNNLSIELLIEKKIIDFKIIVQFIENLQKDQDYIKLHSYVNKIELNYLLDEKNYYNHNIIIQKLKQLGNHLKELNFLLYPSLLSSKSILHPLIKKLKKIYFDDEIIKKSLINSINSFNEIINISCCIGKDTKDIQAIYNISYQLKNKIPVSITSFDISIFNQISRLNFHSAKLETTYNNIYNKIKNDNIIMLNSKTNIFNIINLDKPHNPINDAFMTFVIGLYMIVKLN